MKWYFKGKASKVNYIDYLYDPSSTKGSKGENFVRSFISKNFPHNTWLEQFLIPHTLLRVDFLSPDLGLAIEFDGDSHYKYNKFHHKGSKFNFLDSIKRDDQKEKLLRDNGYQIIRIVEKDLPFTLKWFNSEITNQN